MNIETEIVEIHRSLGRIEGRMDASQNISERVSALERWQSWLKGGFAVLAGAFAYVFKGIYAK